MDQIAKAPPIPEEEIDKNPQQDNHTTESVARYKDVPMDLMKHFGINLTDMTFDNEKKLKDVYRLLDGESLLEKFQNLNRVHQKIGRNSFQNPLDRVWNWLRLHENIKLSKIKQEALEAQGG